MDRERAGRGKNVVKQSYKKINGCSRPALPGEERKRRKQMEGKDQMKGFLRPSIAGLVIGGIIALLGLWIGITEDNQGFLLLILAFWFSIGTIVELQRLNDQMERLEKSGEMEQAVAEYLEAPSFLDEKVRLGETWVFGQGSGMFLRYEEITQVYQYIHKTNGGEDRRSLEVKTVKGDRFSLCKLKTLGRSDEELSAVIAFLMTKNPSIVLGYK